MTTVPSAKVICDSISPEGVRLTTLELTMHRFVLAEFNTHRMFSRNSASSRAIPVMKQMDRIAIDPAVPAVWASEQPGMQGGTALTPQEQKLARLTWLEARDQAMRLAHVMSTLGVHKSIVNRLMEPFMWHTVIVSSTEWSNFFRQRCSPLAQPEIRLVADAMAEAIDCNQPRMVAYGQWHLPYIQNFEREKMMPFELVKLSTARCARVSYLTHDGRRDLEKDLQLYNRLKEPGEGPPHMSPFEHVATPCEPHLLSGGNFRGWTQLRYEIFGDSNRED